MRIRVVRQKGLGAVVEWIDDGALQRVTVPAEAVEDDDCDSEALEHGIPYGVSWAAAIGDRVMVDPRMIEEVLRQYGIWTMQDLRENPTTAAAALMRVYQLDVQRLVLLAGAYLSEEGGE